MYGCGSFPKVSGFIEIFLKCVCLNTDIYIFLLIRRRTD